MPRTIEYEIDLLRKVGEHDFAPTLLQWNTKWRWYVEELINGDHPDRSNWPQFLRTYNTVVAPLLKKLFLASTPEPVEVLQYVNGLDTAIRGQHSNYREHIWSPSKSTLSRTSYNYLYRNSISKHARRFL